jgi:predicted RNA-binding protein (TIGR00451 family)
VYVVHFTHCHDSEIRRLTVAYPTFLDPLILPKVQVDTGAIKFVMSGANVMCPGLTSKGGRLEEDFKAGTIVVRFRSNRTALALLDQSDMLACFGICSKIGYHG